MKQRVSLLPWGHNIRLMQKVEDPEQRLWYLHKAVEHGWSRDMLVTWIDSDLHLRQGAAVTNFERTLPEPQSDLAAQTLKDPYKFDFLTLEPDAQVSRRVASLRGGGVEGAGVSAGGCGQAQLLPLGGR